MNILLIGSGGREHALARALKASAKCATLFIAPGNAGTASLGTNVAVSPNDFQKLGELCITEQIGLVVVGPEEPLVRGIVDFFNNEPSLKHIPIVGPGASGARLEGSKAFSKGFMQRHNIPTAAYRSFTQRELEEAIAFIDEVPGPWVLKADGLAAGKGVLIIDNADEAKDELRQMLSEGKFGEAGSTVVIEAFLTGIEVSVFILTDGINYKVLPEAKDYKRIGEGDTGLNTGGMGAVSPVCFADAVFMKKVEERIVLPTIRGLQEENIPYKGFVFAGLMNCAGEPYVIEYNCRMGDPETEAVVPRIRTDFVDLMLATAAGTLNAIELDIDARCATTVVMVSGGYPGNYEKGFEVTGLDKVNDTLVFHAGTTLSNGRVLTSGGRVFALTSLAPTPEQALALSYEAAQVINYDFAWYRRDIGQDLLKLSAELSARQS